MDKRSPGVDAKQRPMDQPVPQLGVYQEDSLYQLAEIGRVSGEMPRANVSSSVEKFGGYDCDSLRVAGLARSVLIRLGYCHTCSPNYCLLNRSCCRFRMAVRAGTLFRLMLWEVWFIDSSAAMFFFPWPLQRHQVYDENTQRVALMRRLVDDDQWIVPHNL